MSRGTIVSYIDAPRWMIRQLKQGLYDLARNYNVQYRTLEETQGWIRTTLRFEFEGEITGMQKVKTALENFKRTEEAL